MAVLLAAQEGVDTLALSGGVMQNRTLFEGLVGSLRQAGLNVLTHRLVPANDGGISLGQAVIGAARMLEGDIF